MKVLLVNYEFPPLGGGAGNATRHLAADLTTMGDEVKVLTMAHGDLPAREWRDGYEIIRVPSRRKRADRCTPLEMSTFMAGGAYSALKLFRTWKPDAALAFFSIPGAPVAWLLNRLTGVPYALSLRGGDVPGFLPDDLAGYHRLTTPLIRFLWKRAAFVTTNCRWLADLTQRTEPGLPVNIIPNGVDTDSHHPAPQRADGPPQLLLVGRLTRQKGVDILLEALSYSNISRDVRLDIVGNGDERAALEAQAKQLGLADRVTFHSYLRGEALRRQYQKADIFVLPSRDEGLPNVLLEAAASGLPVLTTRAGGCPDAIRDRETGLLVEPDNSKELAHALSTLLSAPDRARAMGHAGRELMIREFSWTKVNSRYRSLLTNLLPRSTG
ncbi:glycosyltransferase family 4 protein [Desulfovibrio sp. JC010]|uniref:glycosyltransferase family 4 protein n=1 Tax=Desulfovibrio sp. JC010 TaxID=2593641 RepID=UPI0013D7606D|nr:glycosyltransferase family 4 protein [Desulfovibrio sp. JC010]NDV27481.1 glycosyltransferase family 4 protein [Desulfovibrio sp. JC010]